MPFKPSDTITLHGYQIGLDREALPLPILKAMLKGWYEADEVRLMKAMLEPNDRVLELGSGIGITTMVAADIVGEDSVFPHELNPRLIEWSSYNFAQNGKKINVCSSALVPSSHKRTDKIDFHIHKKFWGSSLLKRPGTKETIQVPVAALEDTIRHHNTNCLLMDIEGAEVDLLSSADLSGIEKIIMEIHYGIAGRGPTDAMVRHLINNGFSIDLMLSGNGIVAMRRTEG